MPNRSFKRMRENPRTANSNVRRLVIKIDTSPVRYYSQLDEKSFFEWALEIPCVKSIEGGFLHIRSKRISEPDLRDLIAIMHRYQLSMSELQQFCNPTNAHWFKAEGMYWHKSVFGKPKHA